MINNRIFGSPMPKTVRDELNKRQGVTVASQESTEITQDVELGTIQPEVTGTQTLNYYLGNKTPFIRMWTSVILVNEQEFNEVVKEESEVVDEQTYFNDVQSYLISTRQDNTRVAQNLKNNTLIKSSKLLKLIEDNAIKLAGLQKTTKQQIRERIGKRKIYFVGDDKLKKSTQNVTDAVFPEEISNLNYGGNLLKPEAGITSLTSETQGTLGTTKSTTINFIVNNFTDYDKIYNKFFLKPGAKIFVDFGWNESTLYNPEELLNYGLENKGGILEYLYGDTKENDKINGVVTKSNGNLEVIQGVVVDYNSKILKNGSVECSLTIVSGNTALLSTKNEDIISSKVNELLTSGIYYTGLKRYGLDIIAPNKNTTSEDIESYRKNSQKEFFRRYGNEDGIIPETSIQLGFFTNDPTNNDAYITWGRFEDFIINTLFGHGKFEEIENGNNLQIRINSKDEFSLYEDKVINAKNQAAFKTSKGAPKFLFPPWWGDSNPNEDGANSYTFQKNKYPDDKFYINESNEVTPDRVKYDKQTSPIFGRIPIREVFIQTDLINNVFKTNKGKSIQTILKKILEEINKSSHGLFDWTLIAGYNDSEFKVIDRNYAFREDNQESFSNFVFNVMSPTSIIKDYNLEFKIPGGGLGSMLAIRGMSHGDSINTTDLNIQNLAAIETLDEESLSIVYEPDDGSYQAGETLNTTMDGETFNVYSRIDDLLSDEDLTVTINQSSESEVNLYGDGSNNNQSGESNVPATDSIKVNDQKVIADGFILANSVDMYFQKQLTGELTKAKHDLLPYTLTITIPGISSILPGDKFEVDYLPKMHLENTYLQVMKISHDVSSDGWYTNLESQYRTKDPNKKNNIFKTYKDNKERVRLSPSTLLTNEFGLESSFLTYNDNTGTELRADSSLGIKDIAKYMTNITMERQSSKIDFILDFETSNIDGAPFKNKEIQHYPFGKRKKSNFYAERVGDRAPVGDLNTNPKLQSIGGLTDNQINQLDILQFKQIGNTSLKTRVHLYPPNLKLNSYTKYKMFISNGAFAIIDPLKKGPNNNFYNELKKIFQQYFGPNKDTIKE